MIALSGSDGKLQTLEPLVTDMATIDACLKSVADVIKTDPASLGLVAVSAGCAVSTLPEAKGSPSVYKQRWRQ